jgi:hypothetical protein
MAGGYGYGRGYRHCSGGLYLAVWWSWSGTTISSACSSTGTRTSACSSTYTYSNTGTCTSTGTSTDAAGNKYTTSATSVAGERHS